MHGQPGLPRTAERYMSLAIYSHARPEMPDALLTGCEIRSLLPHYSGEILPYPMPNVKDNASVFLDKTKLFQYNSLSFIQTVRDHPVFK